MGSYSEFARDEVSGVGTSFDEGKGVSQKVLRCMALTLCLIGAGMSASAQVIIRVGPVGPATNCVASSLQEAVELAVELSDPADIRLSKNMDYMEQRFSTYGWDHLQWSEDLTISGGWDDCQDNTPSGRTIVRFQAGPFSAWNVVPPAGVTVTLRAIDFDFDGSPGLRMSGAFAQPDDVTFGRLENSLLREGDFGVWVESYIDLTVDFNTSIVNNIQSDGEFFGGGITCGYNDSRDFGASRVLIEGRVYGNRSILGGGVLASDGCQIVFGEGGWVYSNQASLGGGLFLHDGSDLHGGGRGPVGARIDGNTASHGGGLFVAGTGTNATPFNVAITSNTATVGAGVAVRSGGLFHQNRANSLDCPDPPRCAVISNNVLTGDEGSKGSAIFADGGSDVELRQMFLESNSSAGSLVHAEGSTTEVYLDGVQIWGNDTSAVLFSDHGARIDFAHSTMALNFWLFGSPYAARTANGGVIELWSSILEHVAGVEGFGILGLCILVDDDTNFDAFYKLVGVDPQFVDVGTGDLHLRATSPAIDYCFESIPPRDTDYDLDVRGIDRPEVNNYEGPYDLGADEYNSPASMFSDGFETGDTSRWSDTSG